MAGLLILNGPNLNLLGTRERAIYGDQTLADIERQCRDCGARLGLAVQCRQENSEGALIEAVHQTDADAIIINPAAYTHSSIALRDALLARGLPVYEVHLSNPQRREEFRHGSYITGIARGMVCGLGARGYAVAMEAAAEHLQRSQG